MGGEVIGGRESPYYGHKLQGYSSLNLPLACPKDFLQVRGPV